MLKTFELVTIFLFCFVQEPTTHAAAAAEGKKE
jgi:hypothetical protein